MKKYLLTSLILFFVLNMFQGVAHSCSGYSDQSKIFLREDFELCFINFDNNIEKLLYKVSLAKHFNETDTVLILPILKQTNEVVIKIVNTFPEICGNNFERYFYYKWDSNLTYILTTQIYTFPFLILHWMSNNLSEHHPTQNLVNKNDYSKIINIKLLNVNKKSIHEFITNNKLKEPYNLNNIIETYNNSDYSLIMIWPNQDELKKIENKNINLGILISLNTSNIFFPFKWTSFFNESTMFSIYLIGHRTLNYDPQKIKHLIMNNYTIPSELSEFFFNKTFTKNFYYSHIFFRTPPLSELLHVKPYFTDDYVINSATPNNLSNKVTINENILFFAIICFLIISFISSLLASIVAFRNFQPSVIKFAFFGFLNIFSLLGFILATYYFKISQKFTNGKLPNVKFKNEFLTGCVNTAFKIFLAILALIFLISSTLPMNIFGALFILIYILVLIARLLIKFDYYNELYIILFSAFFSLFTIISINIYKIYSAI